MRTYLMIGLIVQIAILIERFVTGKAFRGIKNFDVDFEYFMGFMIGFVGGCAFNIVLWPVTIGFEIYDVIHDQ